MSSQVKRNSARASLAPMESRDDGRGVEVMTETALLGERAISFSCQRVSGSLTGRPAAGNSPTHSPGGRRRAGTGSRSGAARRLRRRELSP